jgi:hypothetical protein
VIRRIRWLLRLREQSEGDQRATSLAITQNDSLLRLIWEPPTNRRKLLTHEDTSVLEHDGGWRASMTGFHIYSTTSIAIANLSAC